MSKRFKLPSPGTLMGAIALFVALGGIAYAANVGSKVSTEELARGAVTSQKLHGQSVGPTKIRANAVRGGKVRDGSLTGADLADNTVTGTKVDESTLGNVPRANVAEAALKPVAYAFIDDNGTVSQAFNITSANLTLEQTSAFCFRELPFTFATVMVSPELDNADGVIEPGASVGTDADGTADCSPAAQVEVATTRDGAFGREGFFIWFFN